VELSINRTMLDDRGRINVWEIKARKWISVYPVDAKEMARMGTISLTEPEKPAPEAPASTSTSEGQGQGSGESSAEDEAGSGAETPPAPPAPPEPVAAVVSAPAAPKGNGRKK
jgi:hypothetical protein